MSNRTLTLNDWQAEALREFATEYLINTLGYDELDEHTKRNRAYASNLLDWLSEDLDLLQQVREICEDHADGAPDASPDAKLANEILYLLDR